VRKVSFTVNGRPLDVVADERQTMLLDVVRDDLSLTGAKQSCDRKGQCGTCMVLLDGRVARACQTPVEEAAGRRLLTIEGLGTPEHLHPLQQAFVELGATQCG